MTKPNLTKENLKSIGKVALYAGISAALSAIVVYIEKNPGMLGVYTPIINVILVTIIKAFKTEE
nr:MAG TPA: hypothetical protein [Caudoviricetes sp.]